MRYDISKLQFSHTLSIRGATVALSQKPHKSWDLKNVLSYDLYTLSIYNLERLLLTFTPTNCVKLRYISVLLNFWFLHTLRYLIFVISQKGQL